MGSNDEKTSIIAAEVWDRIRDKVSEGDGKTGDFVAIIQAAIEKATEQTDAANCSLLALAAVVKGHPDTPEGLKALASKELLDHSRGAYLIHELRSLRAAQASEPWKVTEGPGGWIVLRCGDKVLFQTKKEDYRRDLNDIARAHNATLSQRPTPATDDTKRLDWLDVDGCANIDRLDRIRQAVFAVFYHKKITIRTAIDAAMSQTKEKE